MTTTRPLSPRSRNRRGSAMVEFAVMAPLFLALLGGVMDFSRLFYLSMALNNAARAGVQFALSKTANMANYPGMASAAIQSQPNVPGMTAEALLVCRQDPSDASSTVDGPVVQCSAATYQRQYLSVETTKNYSLFSTYLLLPGQLTVKGRAMVRLQ